MTSLHWITYQDGTWCDLFGLNLADPAVRNAAGVYVIWKGGWSPETLWVGQGQIAERLAAHRAKPAFQGRYTEGVYVTWALVQPPYRDGVESYIFGALRPVLGQRTPTAVPLQVNLPWITPPAEAGYQQARL